MAEADREVFACHRVLAKASDHTVGEVLPREGTYYEYNRCPLGDIYNRESHSQYYYHAHLSSEHGHFCTFLREQGQPIFWLRFPRWKRSTGDSIRSRDRTTLINISEPGEAFKRGVRLWR